MNDGVRPTGDESAILRWAAGGSLPPSPHYDESLLLEAAKFHHIGVRLHDRLTERSPDWASKTLVSGAAELAQEAVHRTRELYDAFHKILADAEGRISEPLLLKGFSYHLTLRDGLAVTWSADLDLVADDLPGLCTLLSDLGYLADPKDPPLPNGRRVFHEYAKFDSGPVQIDVHSRFPVWRYPVEAGSTKNVEPGANPGLWSCVGDFERFEVSAAELLRHRRHVPGLDGEATPITTPEMVALVSCCHIFANYVTEFPKPYATVRLGEVANLAQLTSQLWFDWELFNSLTLGCDAADAVAFAFSLLRTWLGMSRPVPTDARWPTNPLPPRDLWFARGRGGFLVSTANVESVDDILVRQTSLDSLLACLGVNEVLSDRDGSATCQAISANPGSPTLDRVLTQRDPGALPLQLSVRWLDTGLEFLVSVRNDSHGRETNILFSFADVILECIEHSNGELHVYDRGLETRLGPSIVPFTVEPGQRLGYATYRIVVPWHMISSADPVDGRVPLLLGARLWERQGDYPEASTLLPLVVLNSSS
jgi:hypothetical protein